MVQNEYLSWFKVGYFPVDKYVVKRFSYSSCCVKPPPRHPLEMLFSPFLWSCIGRNLYEKNVFDLYSYSPSTFVHSKELFS